MDDGMRAHEALIEKTPGVCGGSARLVRTRVPVWTLERYRQLGSSIADLVEQFPALRPIDVRAAFDYAAQHVEEITTEIAANETA